MSVPSRRRLLSVLVLVFFVQTGMVYTDDAGWAAPPLSPRAQQGQELWLAHNCQSCHQLYGFGGFLGPDLTNSVSRITRARFDSMMTTGVGQMPPFDFDQEQRDAVVQFLTEVDQTGVGQFRLPAGQSPGQVMTEWAAAGVEARGAMSPSVARGWEIVQGQACIGCHLPNPLSTQRSTDLAKLTAEVAHEEILLVLDEGRPRKGMPRMALSMEDREAVIEALDWMAEDGDALREAFSKARLSGDPDGYSIPWFDFP